MYKPGELIDGKYIYDDVCSDTGGMGELVFVTPIKNAPKYQLVLKYCKENGEEFVKRFRREVRLLLSFKGNSKVVDIYDSNLEHDPPYFVMRYYPEGDLTALINQISDNFEIQERIFLQMIDCINELHQTGKYHRDIKPQNFLIDQDMLVISDFGLSTELDSRTQFTRSSVYWGTHGFLPPEYILSGGFKHATASSDIFMLGKSFYVLLTGRDPQYLSEEGIHPAIYHMLEKCCSVKQENRYQSLAELKQSLKLIFDVIQGRTTGGGEVQQLMMQINDKLKSMNRYDTGEVKRFLDILFAIGNKDISMIIQELPQRFYKVIAQEPFDDKLDHFLKIYEEFVPSAIGPFAYAEVIASNMAEVFRISKSNQSKFKALEIACLAAFIANRYAAMDTCRDMICSVTDDGLAVMIVDLINSNEYSFVSSIESINCRNKLITSALRNLEQI